MLYRHRRHINHLRRRPTHKAAADMQRMLPIVRTGESVAAPVAIYGCWRWRFLKNANVCCSHWRAPRALSA